MEGFITTQVNTKGCAQYFKGLHKVLTKNQSFVEISASTKFSVRGREPLHKPAPVRWWPLQSRWCNLCQIKFFFLAFACQSPVMGLYIDTMVSHRPNTLGSSPPQFPLMPPLPKPDSECYDYDLDCLANVARDFGVPVPRGGRSLAGFGKVDPERNQPIQLHPPSSTPTDQKECLDLILNR